MYPTITGESPVARADASRAPIAGMLVRPTLLFALFAAALSFFTLGDKVSAVWNAGAFFDTDDAMRLVQVRALMHGQAWFDMTAKAMDPPVGVFLHWSRIVDIPIVGLIKFFSLAFDTETAERLARLAFPFALLVALFLGMARLADLLLGPSARIPAIAATLMSGNGISQFIPGRIDHHSSQIVLLVGMLCATLTALDPAKARWAALAGIFAALSLAISLENLPFILCLSTIVALVWVWEGSARNEMLASYAIGLAVALPLLFVATVAPSRYFLPVCDALGAGHLGAGVIGALGCVAATLASNRLGSRLARLSAIGAVGGVTLKFVLLAYPGCLHDPFAGVDPLIRDIWMSNVEEALTFMRLLQKEPGTAWTSIIPVVLGLVACLVAVWRTSGRQRLGFMIVTSIVAVGLALAFWQIRVFTSITAIALCGGLYVVVSAQAWIKRIGREDLASLALLLVFPFTATAVAVVLALIPASAAPSGTAADTPTGVFDACLSPKAFAPLRTLPPGRVVAPVDAGSFLLADTAHSVFAAAYHRNNDGTRFAFDLMSAPAATARTMAARRDVRYVMTCPGLEETKQLAGRHPDGLAADLLAKRIPAWLQQLPLKGTPFTVYRVVHAAD